MSEPAVEIKWDEEVAGLKRKADEITVTTDDEIKFATDILSMVKDVTKSLEAARTTAVKPLNDRVKEINGSYKPLTDALAKAESIIKNKILAYQNEKRRKEQEERRKFEEEQRAALEKVKAQSVPTPVALPTPPPPVQNSVSGSFGKTTFRKVRKFRVIDFAKVPDQFKVINESAVREYMNAHGDAAKLDGIEFYIEEQVSAR